MLEYLLEFASYNNVEGVRLSLSRDPSCLDKSGFWYNDMRTPLMVAATYGSIDVVKLILCKSNANVNRVCGKDQTTALHCAVSGGSVQVVQLLLEAGADLNLLDVVTIVPPELQSLKMMLQELQKRNLRDIYATDEFRMYYFKIKPCSCMYPHDWEECPFLHPQETISRRRDLEMFHYFCVLCPDLKKGGCVKGDMCEYAHNMLESMFHPVKYRILLCKYGIQCTRRYCSFAHTPQEIRHQG